MICFALYSANHAMQRTYGPLLDEVGLTYPQYLVLITLWGEDGQSVGQIGRALQLESNTLTPLLKRVEALGLVTRTRSVADERQVIVALTEAGKRVEVVVGGVAACFQGLSEVLKKLFGIGGGGALVRVEMV